MARLPRSRHASVTSAPILRGALALVVLVATAGCLAHDAAPPSWRPHIAAVDHALASGDARAALLAWQDAWRAAFRVQEWEAMFEVGHAARQIGAVQRDVILAEQTARRAYMAALLSARRLGSLDGVLEVTQAFAALGDHEVVEQALGIARAVAGRSPEGQARVRAVAERLQTEATAAVYFRRTGCC